MDVNQSLTPELREQLKALINQYVKDQVVLVATLDDSDNAKAMKDFLTDVGSLSPKVTFDASAQGDSAFKPSFSIVRPGTDIKLTFAGIPLGHEFDSFVLALLWVGGHPPKVDPALVAQIEGLAGPYKFEVVYSLTCNNCPEVVQAINAMAVINPKAVSSINIDGAFFPALVKKYDIRSVPQVLLDGKLFSVGRQEMSDILAKLDSAGSAKAAKAEAARIDAEAPFDVLIVGMGPAGCSAAVYAARKGLRTALVGELFGGQVLDTGEIDNLIPIPKIQGSGLAAQLKQDVELYPVHVMANQRAAQLVPGGKPGALHAVKLESGATVKARTVIAATGARWRKLGCKGEETYLTHGVAYCPHCDGPFFKGRPVAVAGGGNSGVEAAIDLANICSHVTLLQRGPELKADQVLQDALYKLPNVKVLTNATPEEVKGDGTNMTGLDWTDRTDGSVKHLDVDALFVQIGLLPNSAWVKDAVELNKMGEIVINECGATSIPGVFGAGDVASTPYKQIIISMGSGATAALAAFDYMIRTPTP
ncbi:alkyl hydroperoxide reductase subunit F [Formicincola oecophyllae]|uniref:Thioredoxin reductase n=1 Tax=Formicincola oecophyllae TaxID=2558361 RepID=A0A4Y6UAG0_9PROT|nr:alkyl hydroperoxide reductase subunit F [Formicincola oecophyllae]QDH13446.1 alkyl hydroperoxide reductase subunit F [Formicincola oecophyllae]